MSSLKWLSLKLALLDIADLVDEWRLFPRIFLIGYGSLSIQACHWYMSLDDPTAQQTAFVTLLSTVFAPLCSWYMTSGKSNQPK